MKITVKNKEIMRTIVNASIAYFKDIKLVENRKNEMPNAYAAYQEAIKMLKELDYPKSKNKE